MEAITPPVSPSEQPKEKKTKKFSSPHTYRVSWPVVFIILLIAAGSFSAWVYMGSVKLRSQLSAKDEQLSSKQKELDTVTADRDRAADSIVTASASADYVAISEWAVKFKPAKGFEDVAYHVVDGPKADPPNANLATTYFLSRSLLSAMQAVTGLDCSPFSAPLGTIVRYKNSSDVPTASGPKKTKKIGEYTYGYYHPQAVFCASNSVVSGVAISQAAALEATFDSLVAGN